MGGTTGPATIAGVLAVQHAEVLATVVLGQAAREGSPFVYGGLPVMASLRTGAAQFGAPEFSRLAVATAQLAHLCGLPVRAGPVEATAIGNLAVQAIAAGELASIAEARELAARSFRITTYEPSGDWDEARARFAAITARTAAPAS